eukprot:627080-Alexandrium_andersonii.AAC.2
MSFSIAQPGFLVVLAAFAGMGRGVARAAGLAHSFVRLGTGNICTFGLWATLALVADSVCKTARSQTHALVAPPPN